jgi:hypothetical protein
MDVQWWAHVRTGQCYVHFGPYASREEAVIEGWQHAAPRIKVISTGYGSQGAHFDIRWHERAHSIA